MKLMSGRARYQGFTIVELLIVIVIIGVLATISTVAYNGVQQRANNAARVSEAVAWKKLFLAYKATNGAYPSMPVGGYCLGTGFPGAKCRDYNSPSTFYTEADSVSLMTMLRQLGSLPGGPRVGVNGTVGPYVHYYGGEDVDIIMVLNGSSTQCPAGSLYNWDDGNGRLLCAIKLLNV
jgi:prepilin-type N-terminal cleavage/methylation domain-containing protein